VPGTHGGNIVASGWLEDLLTAKDQQIRLADARISSRGDG